MNRRAAGGRPVLSECPWLHIDLTIPTAPTSVYPQGRLVRVDYLDLRLEALTSLGGHTHAQNSLGAQVPIADVFRWLAPLPWLGPDLYLTHDHGVVDAARIGAIGASAWPILPADWWEYATGNFEDDIVKASKHPRPGELTQEDVDRGSQPPAGGSGLYGEARQRRLRRRPSAGDAAMAPLPDSVPLAVPDRPGRSMVAIPCEENYRQRLRQALCRPFG